MPTKHIKIICKPDNAKARQLADEISAWLKNRGICSEIGEPVLENASCANLYLVLGGDGTMLGVARKLAGADIPILGINFGHVGFLTSLQPDNWENGLAAVIAGVFPETRCLALAWRVLGKNGEVAGGTAINDVVASRGNVAALISLRIDIDGFPYDTARCDGVIVCSALGSSGYNASCGGPLIDPVQQSMCCTVISPFMRKAYPLVMPAGTVFELAPDSPAKEYFITIDGQDGLPLRYGEKIIIEAMPHAIRLMAPREHFLTRLISLNRSQHGKL